jgi:hypothetical protein
MNPMRLDFKDSDSAPVLRSLKLDSDEPQVLDAAWGGRIKFAEADGRQVVARTEGGCIGVVLK